MKILFVSSYVNNSFFIKYSKKYLDQNLINCTYDYICLNDAPDINNNEKNYMKLCDMITGEDNCYEETKNQANKNQFKHIKIPQNIHNEFLPNQGGSRHIDCFNYFNSNIDTLFPNYAEYDYLCYIDSDCFLRKKFDPTVQLDNYDIIAPMIYINEYDKYPHTGLFFINLKTVSNFKTINWDNTRGLDTGSEISNWLKSNNNYTIKEVGKYIGYGVNYWIENEHTIIKLKMDDKYVWHDKSIVSLIDTWFNHSFYHLRGGSCFSIGCNKHRDKYINNLDIFNHKLEVFFSNF